MLHMLNKQCALLVCRAWHHVVIVFDSESGLEIWDSCNPWTLQDHLGMVCQRPTHERVPWFVLLHRDHATTHSD